MGSILGTNCVGTVKLVLSSAKWGKIAIYGIAGEFEAGGIPLPLNYIELDMAGLFYGGIVLLS